jgi:hypothetical protein
VISHLEVKALRQEVQAHLIHQEIHMRICQEALQKEKVCPVETTTETMETKAFRGKRRLSHRHQMEV